MFFARALLPLAAFGALAAANPFKVEVQEVIKAVFEDTPVNGDSVSLPIQGNIHPDPSSPVSVTTNALARTKEVCFWSGTAPFCDGECPPSWENRRSSNCGDGKCCATGSKRYCCRTFDLDNCHWSGTAPFCSGSCIEYAELEVGRDDCGDGKCCATGSKAKCCKPV